LRCHSELKGWLLDWIGKATDDQVAWFSMMIYNMWQVRNDARETQKLADPKTVVLKSAAALEEWGNIQKPQLATTSTKPNEHWLRPDLGWAKVDADGAYNAATCVGGGDVVI
jgi:hypothetical protein